MSEAWSLVPPDQDPFCTLVMWLKATSQRLQSWSSHTICNAALRLQVVRELIARMDAMQDMRALTPSESWLRRRLKGAYLGLASLNRSITRQRTRFSSLKNGDVSSLFLRVHAAHRKQRNRIQSLQVGDGDISEPEAM